jgi:hypothetical protein
LAQVRVFRLPRRIESDLPTGSTVPYVVERIVAQGKAMNKDRVFIPTGSSHLYDSIFHYSLVWYPFIHHLLILLLQWLRY